MSPFRHNIARRASHAVRLLAGATMLAGFAFTAQPSPAAAANAPYTVNKLYDKRDLVPGDGRCDAVADSTQPGDQCSLRAAIMEANAIAGDDKIMLPAGTHKLTLAGTNDPDGRRGDLDIESTIAIVGSGAGATIIDGNKLDSVFDLYNAKVELTGLTIQNGLGKSGGGIHNSFGQLTVSHVVLRNNASSGTDGGAISSYRGSVIIKNSTISGNTSARYGGGITMNDATLVLENVTLSGNRAKNDGGAVFQLQNSYPTVAHLSNVTVVGNQADSDANGTGFGGGLYNSGDGSFNLRNSIFASNSSKNGVGPQCYGTFNSMGYNLVTSLAGCTWVGDPTGTIVGKSPRLGPLALNGEQIATRALWGDSPAIDAGSPDNCADTQGNIVPSDVRGVPRSVDGNVDGTGRCDMGAYEFTGPQLSKLTPASGKAGSGAFTLVLSGARFDEDAKVHWGTVKLSATLEGNQLKVVVPGKYLQTPGKVIVRVQTPGSVGGLSNPQTFTITP